MNHGKLEKRPWGQYRTLYEHPGVKIKTLTLNPRASIPNQLHEYHEEYWEVIAGGGVAYIGRDAREMLPGLIFHIPPNQPHEIVAYSSGLTFIEVQVALIVPGRDAVLVQRGEFVEHFGGLGAANF